MKIVHQHNDHIVIESSYDYEQRLSKIFQLLSNLKIIESQVIDLNLSGYEHISRLKQLCLECQAELEEDNRGNIVKGLNQIENQITVELKLYKDPLKRHRLSRELKDIQSKKQRYKRIIRNVL